MGGRLSFRPPRGGAFSASLALLRLRGWGFSCSSSHPKCCRLQPGLQVQGRALCLRSFVDVSLFSAGRRRTGLKIFREQRAGGSGRGAGAERAGKILGEDFPKTNLGWGVTSFAAYKAERGAISGTCTLFSEITGPLTREFLLCSYSWPCLVVPSRKISSL